MDLRDKYCDYIPVYTDGSQDWSSVACSTVFPTDTIISMLDSTSKFTAEIKDEIILCCSSVVRAFAHGAMDRRIDPS